jgi:hypothetical protein
MSKKESQAIESMVKQQPKTRQVIETKPSVEPKPKIPLLSFEGDLFEIHPDEILPYGNKPTAAQMQKASQLQFLTPYFTEPLVSSFRALNPEWMRYQPIQNSDLYHGVYSLNKEDWKNLLLRNMQVPFTPLEIKQGERPGEWLLVNPENPTEWESWQTDVWKKDKKP